MAAKDSSGWRIGLELSKTFREVKGVDLEAMGIEAIIKRCKQQCRGGC